MKSKPLVLILFFASLFPPGRLFAQAWSGIISSGRAIDWSTAGVPGGIPARATICSTLSSSATVSQINSALSSCPVGQAVFLNAGTYSVNGTINVPSNVTLRGAGANQTILNSTLTSGPPVQLGTGGPNFSNAVSITGGASAGSTSITVSKSSGISVGSSLVIDQLNDGVTVTVAGDAGSCTWCDGGQSGTGSYAQGQIVEVESVAGDTIGISPALYVSYTLTPTATPFTAVKYAGVENLQVYANNTHTSGNYSNFMMDGCAYCWISGVEGNYTDGDHVDVYWSYFGQIQNSYFSNSYLHTPGTYDSNVDLIDKTSGMLVQNNIFERLHTSIMVEWGASGNVVAHNYSLASFDSGAPNAAIGDIDLHGAHPMFNLFEGNVVTGGLGADSTWGSHSDNTFFRNWALGTTKGCNPLTGRGTVVCTPLGTQGSSGINGWWEFQQVRAFNPTVLSSSINLVGNIVGSAAMAGLLTNGGDQYGQLMSQVDTVVAVCGPSPCGPGSRSYASDAYAYSYGYGESADDGSSGQESLVPYSTSFLHGNFSNVTSIITWAIGLTKTLPASLYLTEKPDWWGSVPFPAIGPDVEGGTGPGGHAYAIPAQNCYTTFMGGTDGSGSPLTFNAAQCYTTASVAPPTNVSAAPH